MSKIFKIFTSNIFWLILILSLGLVVRLYKIDSPIADWHSWRQADTAAVARNFYKEGFNPFMPKFDDMSVVSSTGGFNPGHFRFVEFPIYNSMVYFLYLFNGGVNESLARLVSIMMSLGSTIFVYLIAKKYFSVCTGLLSSFIFAILPYNVFFSRTILPEPTLVFFCLGMFYFIDRWIFEDGWRLYFTGLFFMVCAFLIKPMAIFYLLPLIYSYIKHERKIWPIPRRYYFLFIPALLPFVMWRLWMMQFSDGIPASDWLFNSNGIRFRPAFWRWIIGERFGREILSVAGTSLFLLGIISKPVKGYLLHLLVLSSFLFLIIFATGNVQHDYYQVLIVPGLVIFAARGAIILFSGSMVLIHRFWTIPLSVFLLILTIYLGWDYVKGLYQVNNPIIVEAGKVANEVLPKDAIVIAPYNGDTAFLYQINRKGFPFIALPLVELISRYGVTAYVSTTKDSKTVWVMRHFRVIKDENGYFIVDMTHMTKEFSQDDPEPY